MFWFCLALADLTGFRAGVKCPVKQLCLPRQTSLWKLLPLFPFHQLWPDSVPTETSWILPFILLWVGLDLQWLKTSYVHRSLLARIKFSPKFSVTRVQFTVTLLKTITITPQLKGISLQEPKSR